MRKVLIVLLAIALDLQSADPAKWEIRSVNNFISIC